MILLTPHFGYSHPFFWYRSLWRFSKLLKECRNRVDISQIRIVNLVFRGLKRIPDNSENQLIRDEHTLIHHFLQIHHVLRVYLVIRKVVVHNYVRRHVSVVFIQEYLLLVLPGKEGVELVYLSHLAVFVLGYVIKRIIREVVNGLLSGDRLKVFPMRLQNIRSDVVMDSFPFHIESWFEEVQFTF